MFINFSVFSQQNNFGAWVGKLAEYKTLKGIRGVRLDNQMVTWAPGPKTKYFEHLLFVVQ